MSFLSIIKFLFFAASGGIAFRQFVESNHTTQVAKIAGVIVFLVSVIFVIPDVMALFKNNEASETERLYWESVEKHSDKSLYCEYLEKYPDGQFVKIARKECQEQRIQTIAETPAPVAEPVISKPTQPVATVPAADATAPAPIAEETHQDFEPEMVQLPNGLWMGKYEVTQAQWQAVMGNNPSNFKGDNLPVEQVSWNAVQRFITKLNAKTGKSYRLPTEEEWFNACQAGSSGEYCGSSNVDAVAWYYNNSFKTTHAVGQKTANGWGLYDMSGNVWEWTSSCWDDDCTRKVVRGGSWSSVHLQNLRSDNNIWIIAKVALNDLGFRVVRAL